MGNLYVGYGSTKNAENTAISYLYLGYDQRIANNIYIKNSTILVPGINIGKDEGIAENTKILNANGVKSINIGHVNSKVDNSFCRKQ
ncbi:MAG: hypothetical protein RR657_02830 [Peptostreptococcaceae bacterium]